MTEPGADFDAWQARFTEYHDAAPDGMLPSQRTDWAWQRTTEELGDRPAPPPTSLSAQEGSPS